MNRCRRPRRSRRPRNRRALNPAWKRRDPEKLKDFSARNVLQRYESERLRTFRSRRLETALRNARDLSMNDLMDSRRGRHLLAAVAIAGAAAMAAVSLPGAYAQPAQPAQQSATEA